MRQEDMLKLVREQPFRPFRVHLTNGDVHEVRHPEPVWVTRSTMMIATPTANLPAPAIEDYLTIALIHIVKADYLTPSAPSPTANS
jgi:hypothetical protein